MFRSSDKITLSLINAKDLDGNLIPFSLKFPIQDSEYVIPSNLVSVDVFEYQEGTVNIGHTAFKLFVGGKTSIKDLVLEYGIDEVKVKKGLDILGVDSSVCYQDIEGKKFVFDNISEQDVVVSDYEELRAVIDVVSKDYKSFQKTLGKIKKLSKTVTK